MFCNVRDSARPSEDFTQCIGLRAVEEDVEAVLRMRGGKIANAVGQHPNGFGCTSVGRVAARTEEGGEYWRWSATAVSGTLCIVAVC